MGGENGVNLIGPFVTKVIKMVIKSVRTDVQTISGMYNMLWFPLMMFPHPPCKTCTHITHMCDL